MADNVPAAPADTGVAPPADTTTPEAVAPDTPPAEPTMADYARERRAKRKHIVEVDKPPAEAAAPEPPADPAPEPPKEPEAKPKKDRPPHTAYVELARKEKAAREAQKASAAAEQEFKAQTQALQEKYEPYSKVEKMIAQGDFYQAITELGRRAGYANPVKMAQLQALGKEIPKAEPPEPEPKPQRPVEEIVQEQMTQYQQQQRLQAYQGEVLSFAQGEAFEAAHPYLASMPGSPAERMYKLAHEHAHKTLQEFGQAEVLTPAALAAKLEEDLAAHFAKKGMVRQAPGAPETRDPAPPAAIPETVAAKAPAGSPRTVSQNMATQVSARVDNPRRSKKDRRAAAARAFGDALDKK